MTKPTDIPNPSLALSEGFCPIGHGTLLVTEWCTQPWGRCRGCGLDFLIHDMGGTRVVSIKLSKLAADSVRIYALSFFQLDRASSLGDLLDLLKSNVLASPDRRNAGLVS